MRWDDERYVRVYTRDTPSWCLLSWEARSIFLLLLRVVDRAGMLHIGRAGVRAVAAVLRAPEDVVTRALAELTEDGCLQVKATWLVVPNFTAAQETPQNDAARKRASREKAKARAMDGQDDPTEHGASGPVTPGHSDLICADPIRTDPDPLLRAPARGATCEPDPEATAPRPFEGLPSEADSLDPKPIRNKTEELTLGETCAAVEAMGPAGELDAMARELAAEGNSFGGRCVGYLDSGAALPPGMRATLRMIRDERAKPRPSGVRRTLTLTADEQSLVAVYVAAQKRIRREDVPQLELHGRAAQGLLPELKLLAASAAREGFAPSPCDVLEHKLEHYLRLNDPRLLAEGYPMRLVLHRTDVGDLPRPKRARERSPPGPQIVQAEARPTPDVIRATGAKYGWSSEMIEREIARTG